MLCTFKRPHQCKCCFTFSTYLVIETVDLYINEKNIKTGTYDEEKKHSFKK